MTQRTLSWDINDDGDKVEIFVFNGLHDYKEPPIMTLSVSEITQAAQNKRANKFFAKSIQRSSTMPHRKNNGLYLSASEAREFCEWFTEHAEVCSAIKEHSETFSNFHFTTSSENGIGRSTKVECTCGEVHDITDVSSW